MKFILILIVIILSGCGGERLETYTEQGKPADKLKTYTPSSVPGMNQFCVVVIDSCEYILYQGYNQGSLTHKGNCKNHKL